jgi:uncharacterized membrane protein
MKTVWRKLLVGLAVAVTTALVLGGARIGRIDVWKILLALIGVFTFRLARKQDNSTR